MSVNFRHPSAFVPAFMSMPGFYGFAGVVDADLVCGFEDVD